MKKNTIASKIGRPPKFKTALELAQVADEYFADCDANPMVVNTRKIVGAKQSGHGSEAKSDETAITVPTPYTIEDFCDFANISNWTRFKQMDAYQTADFVSIIRAIEMRIRGQQIRGSLVGMYNANLTARINGIAEKTDVNVNTEQQQSAEDALKALKGQ